MTYREFIDNALEQDVDMDRDSLQKLVSIAYFLGRERATREVSDKYNEHIAEQKRRAKECRYSHMAAEIVGDEDYIHTPDYAQSYSALFAGDEIDLKALENAK